MNKLYLFKSCRVILFFIFLFTEINSGFGAEAVNPDWPPWFRFYRLMDSTRLEKVEITNQPIIVVVTQMRDAFAERNGQSFSFTINLDKSDGHENSPKAIRRSKKVTLSKRGISVLEALTQIAKQSGLKFRIDEFGISLTNFYPPFEFITAKFNVPFEKRELLKHLPPQIVDVGPALQIAFNRTTGVISYQNTRRDMEPGL